MRRRVASSLGAYPLSLREQFLDMDRGGRRAIGAAELAWGLRRAGCSPAVTLPQAMELVRRWGSQAAIEEVGAVPRALTAGTSQPGAGTLGGVKVEEPLMTFADFVKLCSIR